MRDRFSFAILILLLFFINGCSSKDAIPAAIMNQDDFIIIAHRGASASAPEHTMASYEQAHLSGADYIEIDLQMSKDGHLIAMHDKKVDRTTNGRGLVKSKTLSEIKSLDAGTWFNDRYPPLAQAGFRNIEVPTLEEIFEHFGSSANYYIETKSPEEYPGMETELINLLKKYELTISDENPPKIIIQSFSRDSLKKIHKLEPAIPLIQLYNYKKMAELTDREIKAIKPYASGIGANANMVDKNYIKKAQQNGLAVHLYTVNKDKEIQKAVDFGANGIFTDYPKKWPGPY